MFMCVELMLNAVNLTFVTFARELDDVGGQVVVFFVLVVAAAEVVVGLGIIVSILRRRPGRHRRRRLAGCGAERRMVELAWLIPALPLAGFLVLLVAGRRLGEPLAGWLATLDGRRARSSRPWSCVVGLRGDGGGEDRTFTQTLFTWMPAGGFSVDVGFLVDPLSITMCLFVTGVGALIHLYSIGYMHGDPTFSKFFVYLNLFVFSMLMLVLGDNLLVTFLGWEGVGTCSYLLISFWHENDANASAGKKAFVTNRIGDWGFMVAMFLTFAALGIHQLRRHLRRRRRARHGHRHRHRRAALRRRGRQVGAAAAARLAARRHGRPDPGVRPHPRRHDGHRRRLPDDPRQPGPRGRVAVGAAR